MNRSNPFLLTFLILLLPHSLVSAEYAFIVGNAFSGEANLVEIYQMAENGKASVKTSFHVKDDMALYGDTSAISISRSGRYMAVKTWIVGLVAVYSLDADYSPRFIFGLDDEAGAVGFTLDDKFFFSCQQMRNYWTPDNGPRLEAYELMDSQYQKVFGAVAPTTASLINAVICNSHDEIISSGINGNLGSPSSFLVYQFDRTSKTLSLKQQIPDVGYYYGSMSADERLIACMDIGTVSLIERRSDGVFEWKSHAGIITDNTSGWESTGLAITPDGHHIIAALDHTNLDWSGLPILRVGPDRSLQRLGKHPVNRPRGIAISPDGKFVITGAERGTRLVVYRFHPDLGALEYAFDLPHPQAQINCIAFFPNAKPTAVGTQWMAYE